MPGTERLQADLAYQQRRLLDASRRLWLVRGWGYRPVSLLPFERCVLDAIDRVWEAQEDLRHSQRKHWA